jgi:moderate conductance mechanosensitive channel
LTAELSERGLAETVLLLVAFVGLGVGAELLFARATSGVVRRIEIAPVTVPGPRARVVLTRLLLGLARVLCFAAGSIGSFLLFTWPPNLRQVVLGYLSATLVLRLAVAVGRCLFAPGEPRCRMLPISERAAEFWLFWSSAFVGWYAFGYATIQLLRGLGMSFASSQLLAYLLALGLLAIALRLVWRPGSTTAGRVVGTTLTVLIWAAGVAGAKPLMWTLIVAAGTVVLLRVTHRAVMHLCRAEASDEGDAGPQPMSAWTVVVDRVARALVIVAGIWLLSWGWGLDVIEIAARDTPVTRLLIGAMYAVVILLVADLLWQLASKAIDRRLRQAGPAADGHGEEHGPAITPDEVRRRGRLRTLLPILRIVLLVVLATMAVLMALSSLGVQVAPLIAGAGVVGVAIGFGSQTLVKDIISGMFYLLDDAFRVGEYIVSGNYRGTVEGFSLRSIRLRHHRGPIFTVPFGMLGAVQNLSRDWVIDKITLGVTYDTDLDQLKRVVKQVSKEVMADPVLAKGIIEPLKSQGVAAMGDFAIQVKMKFMAKPGQQFVVRRAIYDKIKKAFEANGINFAFPTVTVAGGGEVSPPAAQQALAMIKQPAK